MRARNLKPGFFKNYHLAQIARPWGRLLFEGLWTLADREGRLKDEPEWIRAEIFPYDIQFYTFDLHENASNIQTHTVTVDEMLTLLQNANNGKDSFIQRYEVDGHKYIQILNFLKHQSPHIKESDSSIPVQNNHHRNTKRTRCPSGVKIPDSLTPSSLTPDCLYTSSFEIFWKEYPKKIGKGYARKIWQKVKPDKSLLKIILDKIAEFKQSDQWQKDSGQFIPHPATWLNQGRWEDEMEPNKKIW